MPDKEAKSRININNLLEYPGWCFFDNKQGKSNIILENQVKITMENTDVLVKDFEHFNKGFVDY